MSLWACRITSSNRNHYNALQLEVDFVPNHPNLWTESLQEHYKRWLVFLHWLPNLSTQCSGGITIGDRNYHRNHYIGPPSVIKTHHYNSPQTHQSTLAERWDIVLKSQWLVVTVCALSRLWSWPDDWLPALLRWSYRLNESWWRQLPSLPVNGYGLPTTVTAVLMIAVWIGWVLRWLPMSAATSLEWLISP